MTTTDLADRQAVTELLYSVARAMDTRDWNLLTSTYAPDAHGDYETAEATGREEIIAAAQGFLTPLDVTQHLVGNIEVHVEEDTATTHATFIAQHVRAGAHFLMGGTYDDTLRRTSPTTWQITNRRIRGLWSTGDPSVLTVPVSK